MTLGISLFLCVLYLYKGEKINLTASIFLSLHPLLSYVDHTFIFGVDPLNSKVFIPLSLWAVVAGGVGLWNHHQKKATGGQLAILAFTVSLCLWNGGEYILWAALGPLVFSEYSQLAKSEDASPNFLSVCLIIFSLWFLLSEEALPSFWIALTSMILALLSLLIFGRRLLMVSQTLFLFALTNSEDLKITANILFYLTTLAYLIENIYMWPKAVINWASENKFLVWYRTNRSILNRGGMAIRPLSCELRLLDFAEKNAQSPLSKRQEYINFSILSLYLLVLFVLFISLFGAENV